MARRERGGRARQRAGRAGGVVQRPWRALRNPYPPIDAVDPEGLDRIHEASLTVLEEIGLVFLLPEALDILAAAGADVDRATQRVRFDRGLVMESMAHAPERFTLHARNPARSIEVGGNAINFGAVASPPNVSDLERGRRAGAWEDFHRLVRLGQALNSVHFFGGYPVEPIDIGPQTRHLDCLRAFVVDADKPFHAYSLGRTRILDALEIVRIARGVDDAALLREPSLFTIVNTSSPLRIDAPMLEGVIEMARHGQVVAVTPFTLSGAMAPATIVGALVQQNAEALAGMSFAQLVRPGTPVVYGGFTSNVDMRTGAPAFGTPEYTRAALAGGQLARRYRVPYRSSNANASNVPDAQSAYESEMSLWGAVMGHANLVMHGAGWLEGGLTASFEKMILDAEMLQMMAEFMSPLVVDDDTLALDAIREVGPGAHFFGAAHTLARYDRAFYEPMVSDWQNYESWVENGSLDAAMRARQVYLQILRDFEPPPLDVSVREALDAFVDRRRREGGAI